MIISLQSPDRIEPQEKTAADRIVPRAINPRGPLESGIMPESSC
jgi:hypothetical protein